MSAPAAKELSPKQALWRDAGLLLMAIFVALAHRILPLDPDSSPSLIDKLAIYGFIDPDRTKAAKGLASTRRITARPSEATEKKRTLNRTH